MTTAMVPCLTPPLKMWDSESSSVGEGPVWDTARAGLWWVDITTGRLFFRSDLHGVREVHKFDQMIGAAVPTTSGSMILALQYGIAEYDPELRKLYWLARPEADKPANRFNDAKCDQMGRLWAGTMRLDAAQGRGALYSYEKGNHPKVRFMPTTISNGIEWSGDQSRMYFIDSITYEMSAFDYDPLSGDLGSRELAFAFPRELGSPDGMTSDCEGRLWVAHCGGGCLSCWYPETGTMVARIELPVTLVTSCCFGGSGWRQMYVTTASLGLSKEQLCQQPFAGAVYCLEMDVMGRPTNLFRA